MRRLLGILRRVWRRAARLARPLAVVPMRLRGLLLAGAGFYVTFGIGASEADYLLYPAGLCAIALVVLCSLCVTLGAIRIRLAIRRMQPGVPVSIETTHAVKSDFQFPRLAWWPLIDVRMTWVEPVGVDVTLEKSKSRWREVITPRQRGRYASLVRRFTIEDVFGLTAISFQFSWEAAVRIAPATATAGADLAVGYGTGDAFSHPSGRQEGDLVEMRQYGHGDPMRHILWKTFARTRRLLVRMPERAIAPRPTTVAFLVAGKGDEPTCAAARLYLERNLFGNDFLFCADGAMEPAHEADVAVEQIIDSSKIPQDDGAIGIEQSAAKVDRARLASCVVFAPAIDGAWRPRVVEFASRLPAPPTIIIGVDGNEPPGRRKLIARLLLKDRAEPDIDSRALAGVMQLREQLEATGLRVQFIHRTTGQVS